jgi:hypothetical protein
VAIPPKLPAPVLGTEEQAGPKSVVVVVADPDCTADADEDGAADDEEDAAGVLELPELQAAAPRARPAAATETAAMR